MRPAVAPKHSHSRGLKIPAKISPARTREGVKIGRKSETETQTVTEQVRREDIEVERRPDNRTDQPRKR